MSRPHTIGSEIIETLKYLLFKRKDLSDPESWESLNPDGSHRAVEGFLEMLREDKHSDASNVRRERKQSFTIKEVMNPGNSKNNLELDISGCSLKSLPSQIARSFFGINKINCGRNPFREESLSLVGFSELTWLDCSNCELKSLPKGIKNLVTLKCSGNYIQILTERDLQFDNIRYLCLSYNMIKNIPDQIGNLNNLEKLDISHNRIRKIPESVGDLKNLKNFNCSFNKIEVIPSEIGNLVELRTLLCHSNKIKRIPEEIGNLLELKTLDFSNNKLEDLPTQISFLREIEDLDVSNNPLSEFQGNENCLNDGPIEYFKTYGMNGYTTKSANKT